MRDDVLSRLNRFDEVVVLDGGSTDGTAEIARAHGARIRQFPRDGRYPKRRNWFLLTHPPTTPWVLFLDAGGFIDDRFCDALAESIIGLFKTEVIDFLGPWKSMAQVEWETLQWVSWYNNERLHSAIGHLPPQEVEDAFYEQMNILEKAA